MAEVGTNPPKLYKQLILLLSFCVCFLHRHPIAIKPVDNQEGVRLLWDLLSQVHIFMGQANHKYFRFQAWGGLPPWTVWF